jgi:hypothetical protein
MQKICRRISYNLQIMTWIIENIYILNQRVIEIEEENVQRLHMSTYLESLDAENVIARVQSPCFH